jgi:type IV secretory pathway component VirB8
VRDEIGFWLAVAFVAVAAVALFKLAAASPLGEKVPGVRSLAAFV